MLCADHSVDPTENFYLWSNGNWKKKNEIPAEYSSWNTFIALRDLNLDRIRTILNDLAASDAASPLSSEEQKLSAFYASAMDEEALESLGAGVLDEMVALIRSAATDPTLTVAKLHSEWGVRVLFSLYSSPDKTNADHSIATLSQGGLGLPDRDYYFDADKQDKRDKYLTYIETLLALLVEGSPAGSLEDLASPFQRQLAAKEILLLETVRCCRLYLAFLLSYFEHALIVIVIVFR